MLTDARQTVAGARVVQHRLAAQIEQADMQMHTVAHRFRCSFRRETQVEAHLPGDLPGDLANVHRAVCGRYAERRTAGDFVLMLAVFGQEHFRLDAASTQGAE